MNDALLVELLTEELPPRSLQSLGHAFAQEIRKILVAQGFVPNTVEPVIHATPRRLAMVLPDVLSRQPDRLMERRGPGRLAGLNADGTPTPALNGFARSCGVGIDQLQMGQDAKGQEVYLFRQMEPGKTLEQVLPTLLSDVLPKLPVAKVMRWGSGDAQFVRPVHGLVVLHGSRVLPVELLALKSGNTTLGHRFLSKGPIRIPDAASYEAVMEQAGHVLTRFERRRQCIGEALEKAAGTCRLQKDDVLLDEVTALVEWPGIYAGSFPEDFLAVPQECLILSMKQHQKYFPLLDDKGRLTSRFLVVSNVDAHDPAAIVKGNERVLKARLSDARFFFEQDRKVPLAQRVIRLGPVVYHNRLGSMGLRIKRLEALSVTIARRLGLDEEKARRAAHLMKADLVTDMVGEFPELQGIMGKYYALHDGESPDVAQAIEEHYHPRFAQDTLPESPLGAALALAEKLDSLTGIFGIGQSPTGDRDPFGLRRAALGIIRILVETPLPLNLADVLTLAVEGFSPALPDGDTRSRVEDFILERMRGYLKERQYASDEIESVLNPAPARLDQVLARIEAVRVFAQLPEAVQLSAANKRIRNLLKKTASEEIGKEESAFNARLLKDPAEQSLHEVMQALQPLVADHLGRMDYVSALQLLARLREPVDRFFTEIMVLCDDEVLRSNRLALLRQLETLMNGVADISRLGG